jgi:hypothetical protein
VTSNQNHTTNTNMASTAIRKCEHLNLEEHRRGVARSAAGFKLETSPRVPLPAAHAPTAAPPAHPPRPRQGGVQVVVQIGPGATATRASATVGAKPVVGASPAGPNWDLLGKILGQVTHLAGEILFEGNRRGLDRSCSFLSLFPLYDAGLRHQFAIQLSLASPAACFCRLFRAS